MRGSTILCKMLRIAGKQDSMASRFSTKGVLLLFVILIVVYACLSLPDISKLTVGAPTMRMEKDSVHKYGAVHVEKKDNTEPTKDTIQPLQDSVHKHGFVHVEKTDNTELPEDTLQPFQHSPAPVILIWSYLGNLPSEGPGPGPVPGGCTFSNDRNDLANASAVLFEYDSLNNEAMTWQHYRHEDQVFIFRSEESPPTMKWMFNIDLKKFGNHFINWTMTYRRDADVYCPYTGWNSVGLRTPEEEDKRIDEIVAQKSKVALWVVSNCGRGDIERSGSLRRWKYVTALSKAGLPIDKYGHCFDNKIEYQRMTQEEKRSYKFYIAFENSHHCRDYLTEKFWRNALSETRVPIVWGPSREDMEAVAPPHSYVFAEDFDSNEKLVEYVLKLAQNNTEYRRYFEWRKDPKWRKVLNEWQGDLYCLDIVCRNLQEQLRSKERKSIPDLEAFWYGTESKECMMET